MIRLPIMDINPKSEFVTEPGLIEISQPQLLTGMNGFIRCLRRTLGAQTDSNKKQQKIKRSTFHIFKAMRDSILYRMTML